MTARIAADPVEPQRRTLSAADPVEPQRRTLSAADPVEPQRRTLSAADPVEPQRRTLSAADPVEPQRRTLSAADPVEPQRRTLSAHVSAFDYSRGRSATNARGSPEGGLHPARAAARASWRVRLRPCTWGSESAIRSSGYVARIASTAGALRTPHPPPSGRGNRGEGPYAITDLRLRRRRPGLARPVTSRSTTRTPRCGADRGALRHWLA